MGRLLSQGDRCADTSRAANEELLGTAPEGVRTWLLLEFPGHWGTRPLQDSALPDNLKQGIAEALDTVPGTRFQLVRRADSPRGGPVRLLVAHSENPRAAIWQLALPALAALADLDLPAWLRGDRPETAREAKGPLYLVCIHGGRDACCARSGAPTAIALEKVAPGRVWRSSHLGGHRFAAVVVTLPFGLALGRLDASQARGLTEAREQGRIFGLDSHFRGRALWPRPVQAAAGLLRQRLGIDEIEAVTLVDWGAAGENEWHVRLEVHGARHELHLERTPRDTAVRPSCGKPAKEITWSWRLVQD